MNINMQNVKIEATRYGVSCEGKQIGICTNMGGLWTFFCNLDNSVTKGPTADLAIARKIARLQVSFPARSGNK